jgi:hypothetical protein
MHRRTMVVGSCTTLLAGCAGLGGGAPRLSDYAREKRWAAEFEPGVVVGDVIELEQASGHRFKAIWAHKPGQTRAIVLVHGIGSHPDHSLTGMLRSDLHDAGYATLAIQAPILDPAGMTDAAPYAALMPEASERIAIAVNHVRGKGAMQVFLVGHTMGAWMVNEFFARNSQQNIVAWTTLGYTGGFGSFGVQRPATLDVYTERGSEWTRSRAPNRIAMARDLDARSEQLYVLDTDLSFAGQERAMAREIAKFFGKF